MVKSANPNVSNTNHAFLSGSIHFLKNTKHGNRFSWLWLHYDGNYDMLRHFQITSYPWFILIDPEGRMPYTVTPAPSSGFLLNAPWNNNRNVQNEQYELFKH